MTKLLPKDKFIDLSDYGRSGAVWLVGQLKNSYITPIHITLMFGVVGLMAVFCIIGLGFQLLIIALMLNMHLTQFVIPFFIVFSTFIPIFIFMRKFLFGTTDENSGTKNAQGLN